MQQGYKPKERQREAVRVVGMRVPIKNQKPERIGDLGLPEPVLVLDYSGNPTRNGEVVVENPMDKIARIAEGLREKMARLDPFTGLERK